MDELHGTQSFAKRQRADAAVTQSQFGDLVKKVVAEFTALRAEVSSLRRRVEQLEPKGAKS
jgi:polyhydroxyalkanoate synthesis regulator phasin